MTIKSDGSVSDPASNPEGRVGRWMKRSTDLESEIAEIGSAVTRKGDEERKSTRSPEQSDKVNERGDPAA